MQPMQRPDDESRLSADKDEKSKASIKKAAPKVNYLRDKNGNEFRHAGSNHKDRRVHRAEGRERVKRLPAQAAARHSAAQGRTPKPVKKF